MPACRAAYPSALQVLLDGTTLRHAVRDIIFGSVVLGSILVLRGRSR
jgi:hypothetical protein